MTEDIIKNFFRFILLVLIQTLIIKNVELGRFMHPFLYVMVIITLPFNTPNWLLLLLAFLLGLSVDLFYDTPGMHAAACVLMAYARPSVLKLFSPREGYETGIQPTIQFMGAPWFLSYAGILIFLHHTTLFFIEVFRFSEFFSTLFRVILSSIATLILVVVSQFMLYRNRKKK